MAGDAETLIREEAPLPSRWGWYAAGIALLAASLLLRQTLLVMPGLLLIVLGLVPALWYHVAFRNLSCTRSLSQHHAEIGDELWLNIAVTNRGLLPLPRLELFDEVPEEGLAIRGARLLPSVKPTRMVLANAFSLWIAQRLERRYRVLCRARGVYTVGPGRLVSSDPFGIVSRELLLERVEHLVVYPLTVPLERLNVPARALLGTVRVKHTLIDDPLSMAGVRPYMRGDDPRRIHWKASARMNSLHSKIYDSATHPALILLADVRTYAHGTVGYDPDLLELALSVTASVARWALDHSYPVGLYSNGLLADVEAAATVESADGAMAHQEQPERDAGRTGSLSHSVRVSPSTHPQQIERIRDALARLVPYFAAPIPQIVTEMIPQLSYGSTIVYVGTVTALEPAAIAHLEDLRVHGHAVLLLLTGERDPENLRMPWIRVGDQATWQRLVRDSLGEQSGSPRHETGSSPQSHPVPALNLEASHA